MTINKTINYVGICYACSYNTSLKVVFGLTIEKQTKQIL